MLGAKVNELILAGQVWRLITPILLHASILHIGFNMYALFVIGPQLERFYGHGRFLLLYLIAGFTGNVLSFVLSPNPSLGASTSVLGWWLQKRYSSSATASCLVRKPAACW